MDFLEEWPWANDVKPTSPPDVPTQMLLMKSCQLTKLYLKELRELLHPYAIVGGMPEAVSTFLATNQIGTSLQVQRRIVDEYKSDMIKYALPTDKSKIRECS